MNMLGLLPKITDEDWSYIEMWLEKAKDYQFTDHSRKEALRRELPLMDRDYVKRAGEDWCQYLAKPTLGSRAVMKKLFG